MGSFTKAFNKAFESTFPKNIMTGMRRSRQKRAVEDYLQKNPNAKLKVKIDGEGNTIYTFEDEKSNKGSKRQFVQDMTKYKTAGVDSHSGLISSSSHVLHPMDVIEMQETTWNSSNRLDIACSDQLSMSLL